MTGLVAKKVTVAILKLIPFFDWQPVKRFEKRSSVFMSAFVKSSPVMSGRKNKQTKQKQTIS